MEKFTITILTDEIHVTIKRRKLFNLSLKATGINTVTVYANYLQPLGNIKKVLLENVNVISQTIGDYRKTYQKYHINECLALKEMWYLGKLYTLDLIKGEEKIIIDEEKNTITIQSRKLPKTLKQLKECFILQLQKIFDEAVTIFNKKLSTQYEPGLVFKNIKSNYGFYYILKDVVLLSTKLIYYSSEEIQYVCFHELCHIEVHSHKAEFYRLLSQFVPNYKDIKKNMKSKGIIYGCL